MFTKSDIGPWFDNSSGIYSEAETIDRLVAILREHNDVKASRWCMRWIVTTIDTLSNSPTAKDDVLNCLQGDIDELTDLLNDNCSNDVAFEWNENSLCLVAIEEE